MLTPESIAIFASAFTGLGLTLRVWLNYKVKLVSSNFQNCATLNERLATRVCELEAALHELFEARMQEQKETAQREQELSIRITKLEESRKAVAAELSVLEREHKELNERYSKLTQKYEEIKFENESLRMNAGV